MTQNDFLFRGDITELDSDVAELIRHETARQAKYLILIPSESSVPQAVREALSSAFHNIYAEGYPLEETRTLTQQEILDYSARLPEFRRQSDQRYYKGTEYADIIENLARRRAAELFATDKFKPEQLYVNVQPLSGAPANNAIYTGLLNVGDTVMGMDLIMGGHLTHCSPVNRSGKFFNIVSYGIHSETERLDYDAILALAKEHRPRMIIAGYSSYPFAPDWNKFRAIADEVGAYLMADIAHVAGLVVGGVFPNPVGIADVVNFTTHKTLHGPRGAVIITHKKDIANKIDRAVFPGEQGGPHMHQITALAVALRLANTDQFRQLQRQIVVNAARMAEKLASRGLRLPHGGTDTHLMVVDCKSVVGSDGTPLSGDMAARILDLAGIVANRQTIPGDTSALRPSGIRLGTPWITQRGFKEKEIDRLGDLIADLLFACVPFSYTGKNRAEARAKVDFDTMQRVRLAVRDLAASVGIDTDMTADGYPHLDYVDALPDSQWQTLVVRGIGDASATGFLNTVLTSDVEALKPGEQQPTWILSADGSPLSRAILERTNDDYRLHIEQNAGKVATWLRALSDGFALFDPKDPYAKVPGPVTAEHIGAADTRKFSVDTSKQWANGIGYANKAYFVGLNGEQYAGPRASAGPRFEWAEPQDNGLLTTTLHTLHKELSAKMVPFAGYDMPVWYSSVTEEHLATRNKAGLFDVTHMGVFDIAGPGALTFLDTLTTNSVASLNVGESHYTYLLDVDGIPFDDLMIYRLAEEHYLMVVNASNNNKNWAWLNAVANGEVMIDPDDPSRRLEGAGRFTLRDLRAAAVGSERRVDVALQGPESKNILLSLHGSESDKKKVDKLPWAGVTHVNLGGHDLIVSRTGYTGERVAFELFIHPDKAPLLFKDLIEYGAVPCGLAARDSLRTEAGLPLYGHELAGSLNLNPADAGFSAYVKLWKPFFVGKSAFVAHEQERDAEIVRFRIDKKGARPPHQGDPLVDDKGRVVGIVTSCSIDSEGYQLGQAYMKESHTKEGTQVGVFAGSSKAKAAALEGLRFGDKVPLPEPATVLSRMPKKKK
jgi:glycine hydroxymethyltransferase